MEHQQIQAFDRTPVLAELLAQNAANRIVAALNGLLGSAWQIVDAQRQPLLGQESWEPAVGNETPLVIELEPIGFLRAAASSTTLDAVAKLIAGILFERWRYLMSADLHFESSYSDYRELQLKNEALQESEARYRELAKHLEQRVEQQVVLIRQQQRELYQSEKLAAVGQLAAGIAHEINNPIGFVKSNSTTARTYLNRLQATLQQLREKGVADVEALWQQQDLDFLFADFQ